LADAFVLRVRRGLAGSAVPSAAPVGSASAFVAFVPLARDVVEAFVGDLAPALEAGFLAAAALARVADVAVFPPAARDRRFGAGASSGAGSSPSPWVAAPGAAVRPSSAKVAASASSNPISVSDGAPRPSPSSSSSESTSSH
jgi:hypothetical protein